MSPPRVRLPWLARLSQQKPAAERKRGDNVISTIRSASLMFLWLPVWVRLPAPTQNTNQPLQASVSQCHPRHALASQLTFPFGIFILPFRLTRGIKDRTREGRWHVCMRRLPPLDLHPPANKLMTPQIESKDRRRLS